MSDIIGYRPNDNGLTAERIREAVKASRGRINKSDILRAAVEEYLEKLEKSGSFTVDLKESSHQAKPASVPVQGGGHIKAGASTDDQKPVKKTRVRKSA